MVASKMIRVLFLALVALLSQACTYTVQEGPEPPEDQPVVASTEDGGMGEGDVQQQRGPKKTTWALTGNLTTGDSAGSINLQTGDLTQLGYAYYTVKFGVTPPAGATPLNSAFNATATIRFVVNGNPIVRVMSVGQGAEISGTADSISVLVQDATPSSWLNAGKQYSVTVAVAPGTRVAGEQPTLRDINTPYTIASGNTVNVNVPQNSGVVALIVSAGQPASGTASDIDVFQVVGAIGVFDTYITGFTGPIQIPLAPGVTQLQITNASAVTQTVSLLWVIDG